MSLISPTSASSSGSRSSSTGSMNCKCPSSYFSGMKVRWLIDNVPQLQSDLNSKTEHQHIRFGTIDTWLLYMLSGYTRSVLEIRTESVAFHEFEDLGLGRGFGIGDMRRQRLLGGRRGGERWGWGDDDPNRYRITEDCTIERWYYWDHTRYSCIPCPNLLKNVLALENVVIGAILGNQQAALFGQSCFLPGEAKCTYGTGLFQMMNTGVEPMSSTRGLLTTVAYQIAGKGVVYAFEVAFSGSTIGWLRDRLELIKSASETESLALSVHSNEGMYLVPAFSGLFAPHWRPDAHGCMVGLTASHTKAHIVQAALESSAYQAREVFNAMVLDSDVHLKEMKVDGGATANKFLMQFQSDILSVPVIRPQFLETTGMGAAFAAGLAVNVWGGLDDISMMWHAAKVWKPTMVGAEREKLWNGWNKAVQKSLNWIDAD
ncbi:hypothetical protein ACHAXA_002543 [Cyclostephanos tholiformis]|uniref:glycerol kinase n=1 Tax=Cyclostephanos tholiformis TaxID=382380 RepID=A0ABD3RJL4_9STRA